MFDKISSEVNILLVHFFDYENNIEDQTKDCTL